MKKINLLIILIGIFLLNFLAVSAYSQDKPKLTPEERAAKITTALQPVLSLSDEQYNQVYNAYLSHFTKMKELKNSGNDTDKKEQMKSYRKDFQTELKKILTEEQIDKLKAYKKEKRENHKKEKRENHKKENKKTPESN